MTDSRSRPDVHVWNEHHVDVQDRQNELPAVRALRARTRQLLSGLAPAVDLGCGTGTGALELGPTAVGVDSSETMCAASAARGLTTVRGDVTAVPIRSGSVAAVRCDRVLYHLHEPIEALRQARRLLRTGGRIACTHPDHESMVIAVPDAPEHLVALAKSTRIELNYVNGKVPRHIPAMLLDLGFVDVRTEAFTVVVEDPDTRPYALPHWLRQWRDRGDIDVSEAELAEWDAAIDAARRRGGFFFTLTYLLTYGTAP